jgi:hypothetical protein
LSDRKAQASRRAREESEAPSSELREERGGEKEKPWEKRRKEKEKGEGERREGSASEERPAQFGHELLEFFEALLEPSSQGLSPISDCAELRRALAQLTRGHAQIFRGWAKARLALERREKGGGLLLELESIFAKARRRGALLEKREVPLEHEREGLRLLERGEGEHRPGELTREHWRRRKARRARSARFTREERRSHEKEGEGLPI